MSRWLLGGFLLPVGGRCWSAKHRRWDVLVQTAQAAGALARHPVAGLRLLECRLMGIWCRSWIEPDVWARLAAMSFGGNSGVWVLHICTLGISSPAE